MFVVSAANVVIVVGGLTVVSVAFSIFLVCLSLNLLGELESFSMKFSLNSAKFGLTLNDDLKLSSTVSALITDSVVALSLGLIRVLSLADLKPSVR